MNILIVEENKIISKMLTKLLKKFCIRLDVARDGFDALNAMKKYGYYIVILNSQIKNTSGLFIAKKIKSINTKTHIIMLCEDKLSYLDKNRSLERKLITFESPICFGKLKKTVEEIYTKVFKPDNGNHLSDDSQQ